MKIRAKVWMCSGVASDGSIIRREVWEEYLRSSEYAELIESGSGLGTLTHRSRNIKCNPSDFSNLKGTTGADDSMLVVSPSMPAAVWKIDRLFIDGDWVCADMTVLDEKTADPSMAEQITRLKSLVRQGCKLGVSAVIVAYWEQQGGNDVAKKIHKIKAIDVTMNPSVAKARITEILEDGTEEEIKTFSDTNEPTCKVFSTADELSTLPKSSKIDLCFTTLRVKEFSQMSELELFEVTPEVEEVVEQKEFSVATVKERLRYAKLSPRQTFRRLMLDYKGAIKAAGGVDKMDPEDIRILKSLFTTDVLNIIKTIYPDIMKGKQIATLIGASSISKNARQACQKLQIPFRMAMQQQEKQQFITKDRYQKIQNAYLEFVNSLIDEVFGPTSHLTELPEESHEIEGNEEK